MKGCCGCFQEKDVFQSPPEEMDVSGMDKPGCFRKPDVLQNPPGVMDADGMGEPGYFRKPDVHQYWTELMSMLSPVPRLFLFILCSVLMYPVPGRTVYAAAGEMTVAIEAEIPLTYDAEQMQFTGTGSLCEYVADAGLAHRTLAISVPQNLTMQVSDPSGRTEPQADLPMPSGTQVTVSGIPSARRGQHNQAVANASAINRYRTLVPESNEASASGRNGALRSSKSGMSVSNESGASVLGRNEETSALNESGAVASTIMVVIPLTEELTVYGTGTYQLRIPLTVTMEERYGSYSDTWEFTPWEELAAGGQIELSDTATLVTANVRDPILEIPPQIQALSGQAFAHAACREVTIPPTVTAGADAFADSLVETVLFDEGLTAVPTAFCRRADHLQRVKLPQTVTTISENAFIDCTALIDCELPDSVTTLGAYAFQNCSGLKRLTIRRNLTVSALSAASSPFRNSGIEEVVIEEGVTAIPARLCTDAACLKTLVLPSTLQSIGANAFMNAGSLAELTLRSDITTDRTRPPFDGCGLQRIIVENGVTTIPSHCFDGACASLREIHLPISLQSIGSQAFRGADDAVVYYAGSADDWQRIIKNGWSPKSIIYEETELTADSAELASERQSVTEVKVNSTEKRMSVTPIGAE